MLSSVDTAENDRYEVASMMPNRLEVHWQAMCPKIVRRWDQLTLTDLETVSGRFDLLVEMIRGRYKPDRSAITVEAKIRDWLTTELDELERTSGENV